MCDAAKSLFHHAQLAIAFTTVAETEKGKRRADPCRPEQQAWERTTKHFQQDANRSLEDNPNRLAPARCAQATSAE